MRQGQSTGMQPQRNHRVSAIDRIAQDRMPQLRQVGAQLVGAPGDRTQPELCGFLPQRTGAPKGDGPTPLGMGAVARWISLQPRQTVLDPPAALQMADHFRLIQLADATAGEQSAAAPQALQASRQQNQTGCIAIEAMHQMQVGFATLHPRDQGVLQMGAASRLTEQTRRLQSHQQPGIPKQNLDGLSVQEIRNGCETGPAPDQEAKPAPDALPPPHDGARSDTDSGPERHPAVADGRPACRS